MNTAKTLQISTTSSEETEDLGSKIGTSLRGGEVILLSSDLGGGKTAFVRGIARGLGSGDHVSSPTFTISKVYKASNLTLYHFDFYRLHEPGIISHELAEALQDETAVVAIEWGEIVASVVPEDNLTVAIKRTGELTRDIQLSATPGLGYLLEGIHK